MRLRTLIKRRADGLLLSLQRLRREIRTPDAFGAILAEVQKSYARLVVVLGKPRMQAPGLVEVSSEREVTKYRCGRIEFLHHSRHGVVSVDAGDTGVSSLILCSVRSSPAEQHLEVIKGMLAMYSGYEGAPCDVCGNYAALPGLLTPTCRSVEEDFVLVHHPGCTESVE